MKEGVIDSQIISLLKENLSRRKIAKILHVGRDRIREVEKSMEKGETISHIPRGPRKINSLMRAKIVQLTILDVKLSDSSVAEIISKDFKINISRSSVNSIRHEERFNYKPP